MSQDSIDGVTLATLITDPLFQRRIRLRFIVAAIAVTTEEIQLPSSQVTGSGASILHFASVPTGIINGMSVINISNLGTVPLSATVSGTGTGTVTIVGTLSGTVSVNDIICFGPTPSLSGSPTINPHTLHSQRLAFAAAILADSTGTLAEMLCMLVLANTTNRTNALAAPNVRGGGNMLDSDIDFQINSIFTGVSASRSW